MSNRINIVLTIIIIILVAYIAYDKYMEDKDTIHVNGNISKEDKENIKYYYYSKNIESDNENMVYKSVYLFEDNTYYYGFSLKNDKCNNWSKGTYELSDTELVLKEEKYGGCSTCYYTDNTHTYMFRYVNNTLVSSDNEMLTEAKLNILPVIDVENLEGVKLCTH